MDKKLCVKEKIYRLTVPNGQATQAIASEIDPITIGEHFYAYERWDNGPTTCERFMHDRFYLIKWYGKYHVIKVSQQAGNFADENLASWETVATLDGKEISLDVKMDNG